MAVQHDPNGKDDLKTQFITREGTYRLMTLSEYSRPNRVGYTSNQSSPQVRVSIVSLPTTPALGQSTSSQLLLQQQQQQLQQQLPTSSSSLNNGQEPNLMQGGDRICLNYGKEIFFYAYRGIKKTSDLNKPFDKKSYKGTNPSCHDYNSATATADGAPLLVGFTTGQIQLVLPGRREPGKLYNEERLIDKTKVTCLKWLPGSSNLFLASHASGHLYLYNEELPCTPTAPNYQPFKIGDGFSILTCKSKSTRNPLYKWTFGTDNLSINEISFSPCGSNLAIVSQDGFLRVFHYDTMDLIGIARSYFGGFLCVCWSPDGKYIVVGGEDDLVTVWSLHEKRVVARGQGHRSWVSVVAFDPYTTSYSNWDGQDFSDDENPVNVVTASDTNCRHRNFSTSSDAENDLGGGSGGSRQRPNSASLRDPDKLATSYRLGSVSQDTQLCLWDITEDVLRQPLNFRHRLSSHDPHPTSAANDMEAKVIKPVALLTKDDANKLNSNKYGNCSNSSEIVGGVMIGSDDSKNTTIVGNNNKHSNSRKINDNSVMAVGNCIAGTGSGTITKMDSSMIDSTTTTASTSSSNSNTITKNSTSSKSSSETSSTSRGVDRTDGAGGNSSGGGGGISAFNTLTQKLSNFSFGSDKKSSTGGLGGAETSSSSSATATNHNHQTNSNHSHNHSSSGGGGGGDRGSSSKKSFLLLSSKSSTTNNYNLNNHNNNSATVDSSSHHHPHHHHHHHHNNQHHHQHQVDKHHNNKNNTSLTTYDPMRLIGTSACPRFDECPVLEPLVCKKIAHERLTALIFREDCFLTACQDGFIYAWSRPGSNVPQHISSSPPSSSQPQGSAAV